jgi:hypothetical protein
LHVESVMTFGPREKVTLLLSASLKKPSLMVLFNELQKAPHSPSNYTVFKMISQQLATMIKSCPNVSLQAIMVRVH